MDYQNVCCGDTLYPPAHEGRGGGDFHSWKACPHVCPVYLLPTASSRYGGCAGAVVLADPSIYPFSTHPTTSSLSVSLLLLFPAGGRHCLPSLQRLFPLKPRSPPPFQKMNESSHAQVISVRALHRGIGWREGGHYQSFCRFKRLRWLVD